ncbi:MAG: CpaF family protein [bacterium]|nr:CpaF family protein [bacterium]
MTVKKNSWLKEFEISEENNYSTISNDYDIFKDKKLLDSFRDSIIQELIDNKIPDDKMLSNYINEEIDIITEGYDLSVLERNHLFDLIENEINGYGPITELLDDESVTEIMVNSPNEVYIEVDGQLLRDESISFINDEHIIRTIQRIVQPLGRTIDSSNPMVDSHLPDGSRINAIIPPLSLKGPVLTIRKFKKSIDSIDSLIGNGTMTPYMARFLQASVEAKLNIIVCGGTGSGKTTLLNILSNFISSNERIITIEDAVELRLKQSHVISLETRNVNYENGGEVTIRDLVRNSLRMRPDRIIVGEVRGKEAFDMLQAMNTGHDGSLTTLHANSASDALNRLETMILMSEMDIPLKAIRGYIEKALDLVVNIERLSDGKRKVTSISEIVGFDGENIILHDIFAFNQKGLTPNGEVDGEFILYDAVPFVYKKIRMRGIDIVDDIFSELGKKKTTNKKTNKKLNQTKNKNK